MTWARTLYSTKWESNTARIAGLAFQKRSGISNFDDFYWHILYLMCKIKREQLQPSLCQKFHSVFKTIKSELTSILAAEAALLCTEASTVNNSS